MKTKNKLTMFIILATLSFASVVKADDVTLPVISKPTILDEGTQRTLTQAQIAELLPWAKDSKLFLTDLLDNVQGLATTDKIETLLDGIKQVVGESAPKNSELLMRYALNRGLVLNNILTNETSDLAVGTADAKLRVLRSSVLMAIKYYDTDMAGLTKKTAAPYVLFGLDYFSFLSELNKSVFDASAQYAIQRTALEWLQWDLYRDLNSASYAPQIVKINNALKTFPARKSNDAQSIAAIRQMKKVAQQLNVAEVLAKLNLEKKMQDAKSQAEKERIARESALDKIRGERSEIDFEKIKTHFELIVALNWDKRLSGAKGLSAVPGNDINILFLNRIYIEQDSDVQNVLKSAFSLRFGNNLYLMKNESLEASMRSLFELIKEHGRPAAWDKRQLIASYLGKIVTIESYKLLGEWLKVETDNDARTTITSSMQIIENVLNK
jgi:hypothetical protein